MSENADQPAEPTSGPESGAAESGDWQIVTGWADAMAPLGSTEPVPERAAGRRQPGPGGAADIQPPKVPGPTDAGESEPELGSTAAGGRGGTAKKASTGSAKKTGGRPGARVAITRTRQTKKGT